MAEYDLLRYSFSGKEDVQVIADDICSGEEEDRP